MQNKEEEWNILDSYFHDHMYPFTKHHLDSFKQFIKVHIPDTIASYNPITMIKFGDSDTEAVKVEVYIGGIQKKKNDPLAIYVDRPTSFDEDGKSILLTPNETRLRNITYATKLYADIDIVYSKDSEHYKTVRFNNILLGSIPLMLHSDQCILHGQGSKVLRALSECHMDQGGYFIIDGKEKVIISQERITTNKLFVEKINDPDIIYKGTIRCTGSKGETSLIPRTFQIIVINPIPKMTEPKKKNDDDDNQISEEGGYKNVRGGIFISMHGFNSIIPLTTLFRAIGFESDKSIAEAVCGDSTDKNIATNAFMNFLRPSIAYGNSIMMKNSDGFVTNLHTMADAHLNLKNRTYFKSIQQVKSILTLDLFPNIEDGLREKGMYLGYLVKQVIKTVLGVLPPSDRDSYAFKRVDISGYLLSQLFQETYSKFRKNIRNELDEYYKFGHIETTGKIDELVNKSNINRIFTPVFISDTFTRSLKGMWGQVTDDPEQGLVQDLSRISYIGFLSHLRRVNIPLDRSIKITSPHRLHSHQWGRFCPFETPDGASVGYLKNLALLTHITSGTQATTLYPLLEELKVILLKDISIITCANKETIYVFINGSLYGITDTPDIVVNRLRLYRRNGLINPFISVSWNIQENEIQIHTEAGRPCRPLLIVKNKKVAIDTYKSKKWYDMIFGSHLPESQKNEDAYYNDVLIQDDEKLLENSQGCIEFLDVEEENTMLVAINRENITEFHTHLEINLITLYSVVTQLVPLSNHNQAPRVVFHAAQSKQAIGIYTTNFNKRFDTMGYIQHYPQKRIITTRGSHYNGSNFMPNGTNCIVAIMTHNGFNQEDSVMINKGSIDRGLYQITAYKTLTAIEKTLSPNDRLIFTNPIEMRKEGKFIKNIKHADYTLLDKNGFIKEGSYIPRGQEVVIIGMIHIHQELKTVNKGVLTEKQIVEIYTDVSIVTDVHHYGIVDKIFVGNQIPGIDREDVSRVCKVRFRKIRRPELGDKNCVTPDHEVLTSKGWKFINKITTDDEVYTLSEKGAFILTKPIKVFEVECNNAELYDLQSPTIELCTTLDHNMYVKTHLQEEYELFKTRDIIGKNISYKVTAYNDQYYYHNIDGKTGYKIKYFLELFGYWISNGIIGDNVVIAHIIKDNFNHIIELIEFLDYKYTIDNNNNIIILDTEFIKFISKFKIKYLPEWVWKLNLEQCHYLLNGIIGTIVDKMFLYTNATDSAINDIYYTNSKLLADDIQRLVFHAGWSSIIKFLYKELNGENCYSIFISRNCINSNLVIKTEKIIKYTGKVYCIEVPSASHVFYVRKNGKAVWTGNCSSHGQKGVIGLIIPHEDMPFTKDGIVPDIIINPHAIPSRMTIGHLLETVYAKLCCCEGTIGDGTVYLPFDHTSMFDSLDKYGYEKHANEILYNGRTGNQIETEIFIGPIFYYRLKHMVTDKIHARDKGPKSQLTRQPTGGRSKHGGLRLGEMERDVVLSHGLAQFIKEGWLDKSDKFRWGVCRYCGILANYSYQSNINECLYCNRQDLVILETPYAFKLLIQELESMGLQIRLSPDETINEYSNSESESDSDSDSDISLPVPEVKEEEPASSDEASSDEASSDEEKSTIEEELSDNSESTISESLTESPSFSIGQAEINQLSVGGEVNNIVINELLDDKLDLDIGNANIMPNIADSSISIGGTRNNNIIESPHNNDVKFISIDMTGGRIPEPNSKNDIYNDNNDGDSEIGGSDDMDFFA